MSDLFQTKDEMRARKMVALESEYESMFGFVNDMNGWRRGKVHLFIGDTHAGKTTLVRSILLDAVANKKKVLTWLSEETLEDYKTEMAYIGHEHEAYKNITVVSEQDQEITSMVGAIKFHVQEREVDLVIVDNITTSEFYNDKISEQAPLIKNLKRVAIEENIPLILIAHTNAAKEFRPYHPIKPNDIRGNKTLPNLVEFCFGIHKVPTPSGPKNYINTIKNRGQPMLKPFYKLLYNTKGKFYQSSLPLELAQLKLLIKAADQDGKGL